MEPTASQDRISINGLSVAVELKRFVDDEVLPGTAVAPESFWKGLADLVDRFGDRNRDLLEARARMQAAIDGWHRDRAGQMHDAAAYQAFLAELGYLVDEGPDFQIDTENVDDEFAMIPGPQLVVPVTNARYAINAANARWGSLYDALYGTDAMGTPPPAGPYDPDRGRQVIAWGRDLLDEVAPLAGASHHEVTAYRVAGEVLEVELRDGSATGLTSPDRFAGSTGEPEAPAAVLFRNHNLAVEVTIDRDHPVGATDAAGVADLLLESAVSVIMDLEDSVATVDATDKVAAYRNWLGLLRGDLTTRVVKGSDDFVRRMSEDRVYRAPAGGTLTLPGRAMMLVRNVGLLMTTDIVLDPEGRPVAEGLVDAMVTVACGLHDVRGLGRLRNSRTGSVYVVKPKLHGPEEVAFSDALFHHVEAVLGLEPNTVKLGIMDEERRTSVNLKECIRAARSRVAFINTGFLDRTGDEIHTSMEAGPMVRKPDMKSQAWIAAYEDRNVDIGLACGLPGRAQIGKGMWAAPDRMAAMLKEKIGHPRAGAHCAWVPSPTAATLHATHYHRFDVLARQRELAGQVRASLEELLTIPLAPSTDWSDEERIAELENNSQGILGYVVRWVDQGVGCSKVPDINGIALMEDRATCRISSQHMANWLRHAVTDEDEVIQVMQRMAAVVDKQNADDPLYTPMAPDFDGEAFQAALQLVLEGSEQPSGYTEPILHELRGRRKLTLLVGNPEKDTA